MKKRLDRKDMLILTALGAGYVLLLAVYVGLESAFGSTLDWSAQHFAIPDYFRKLFYETGELFPSFAPNIGAGENIYVLSYYGLYSPVILFSYLLPFVSMATYIQFASAILCFLGGALIYRFFRKNNGRLNSAALAVAYLCATPIILHSHRHIMFVNYMPFLILAYEAVDNYFEGRKKWSLTFWSLMIILTSWFFSVAALCSITVYAVYRYLCKTEKFVFSDFIKAGSGFVLRIGCAVMTAGVLLLPTVYVLTQGRDKSNSPVSLTDLIPTVHLSYLGYSAYSMGMGCFALLAVCGAVLSKDKARRFLGIALASVICVPPIVYILNGTMYLDSKVLIPFIPAMLILCSEQIKGFTRREIYVFLGAFVLGQVTSMPALHVRLILIADCALMFLFFALCRIKKEKLMMLLALTVVPFVTTVFFNIFDYPLPKLDEIESTENDSVTELCKIIGEDGNLWRSSFAENRDDTPNTVPTMDFYSPYIYSSVHHKAYNDFYFNVMNNENEYRNSALTTRSQNLMFEIYISNKYLISVKDEVPWGYEEAARDGDLRLYKSSYALPIGRVQPQLGEDVFDSLNNADKMSALCRYVITGKGGEYTSAVTDLGEFSFPEIDGVSYEYGRYSISAKTKFKTSMDLPFEVPEGKALVIELECDNDMGRRMDARLTINGIRNTLTSPEWKYYNNNTLFTYVILPKKGDTLEKLDLTFTSGDYLLTKPHAYLLDIPTEAASCDALMIDKSVSKGDVLKGTVNASEDGWFKFCVPYDKGFTITVDGSEQAYECVDKAFIGFEMKKGEHTVEVRFNAPLLGAGKLTSLAGLILFAVLIGYDIKTRRKVTSE